MKLRWVIYKNRATAEQVHQYSKDNDVSLMDAKRILEDRTDLVLQHYQIFDDWGNGTWCDVPTEVIIRNNE